MGFLDDLLGNTSADASKAAAADTYAKQQAATGLLRGSGATYAGNMTDLGKGYASNFADLAKGYAPWMATGGAANDAVSKLISDPSSVSSLPGYQFDLSQGTRALDHSAVANGSLFSGKQGKALETFGTNLADKTYGDQLSRLLGVSQQGLSATGAAAGLEGQGISGGIGLQAQGQTGQLGADTSAYGGDMTSAGTIGQGDVAAANAKQSALQNLLNFGGFLGGSYLGGKSSFSMPKFNIPGFNPIAGATG